jgi:hypothetical protein
LQTSTTFTYFALVTDAAASATVGATTAITILTAFTYFAPFTASAVVTFYITSATLAAFTIANCTGIIPLHLEHLSSKGEPVQITARRAIIIPCITTAGFTTTNNLNLYERTV